MINQELTSCCWSPLEATGNIVKLVETGGIDHVIGTATYITNQPRRREHPTIMCGKYEQSVASEVIAFEVTSYIQ